MPMFSAEAVDLLVIGGGMAGSIAAAVAAERGLAVALIRKGYGATALSSGAIDFAPQEMADPLTREAAAFFARGVDAAGCPYRGRVGERAELLTALGTAKQAQLYPASAAAGDLGQSVGGKTLFIGVQGLAEYNAAYMAQAAQAIFQQHAQHRQAAFAEIEFPGVRHTHNVLGFELAQLLDEREIAGQFAESVAKAAQGYRHVALPPIVGLDHAPEVFAILQGACEAACFELLSATPSLLGLRLQNGLACWTQRQARIVHGTVGDVEKSERTVRELQVVDRDTTYRFRPRYVVLATGKFIGGGIAYAGSFQETALGLPVWHGDRLIAGQNLNTLSAASFADEQPFMAAGLRVDDRSRPLGEDGRAAFDNVFAAGALVQGCDYRAGRGSLGTALINGYRVGRWICEQG